MEDPSTTTGALDVRVVDYEAYHRAYFEQFNAEWLNEYFRVEDVDQTMFDDPRGTILERGGHILMGYLGERCVGTCALIQREPAVYELAKMAVTKQARGKHVGRALIDASIARAIAVRAKRLYLATNSRLSTAIGLYGRLGFVVTHTGKDPIYERVDTVMTYAKPLTL